MAGMAGAASLGDFASAIGIRTQESAIIHELKAGTEQYTLEMQKNRRLEDIASNLALEVCYFNLSEYHKSGALLSCMVMHLNRYSYTFRLTL